MKNRVVWWKRPFLFAGFLALGFEGSSQIATLRGTVVDSLTGEPLPYVTILVNDLSDRGTSTDSSGRFMLYSGKPVTSLKLSYVGYETKKVDIKRTVETDSLLIQLSPSKAELEDVVVMAGVNPAHRIIRRTVENIPQNDYTRLHSYAHQAYEKFVLSGIATGPPQDSLAKKVFDHIHDNYILISESVIDRKYLKPDLTKETVKAQKVSGLQTPNFTVLISQFQSTNFYEPYINITTTDFVNPISNNSWERYFFNIEDTLYDGTDTVFVISYHPARGKNFSSLRGILEISSDGYALKRVTAEPADTVFTTLFVKIEQRYSRVSGHWFPEYIWIEARFKRFMIENLMVTLEGKTYISHVEIEPPYTRRDFDGVTIDMLDDAAKKTDAYWMENRMEELSVKEQKTYVLLDSLGKRYHFDRKMAFLNGFQDGLIRFPYISVQIYNTIKFNHPEFMRLGLGLETNNDISRRYQAGTFAGYGLRDQVWKYGGFLKWKIYEPKNLSLSLQYSHTYEESGGVEYFQEGYWGSGTGIRNYTITAFDLVDRKQINFTARVRKYYNIQLSGFTAFKQPTDDYEFLDNSGDEPQLMSEFRFSALKAALRFSYKEKIVESFDHYYWINQGYPSVWLQATQGIEGVLGGDFTYTKIESRISHFINTKSFGITRVTAEGGYVIGTVPASEMYNASSSYAPIGLYAPTSFQTMRSGEFINDRYVAFYFEQDLLQNVLRWKSFFRPNFVLVTNIGWGQITHPEVHVNAGFQSMSKGYYESGVLINNLIGKKLFGIVRLQFGAGAFYRYGPYAFSEAGKNLAFKLNFSYNFK